MLKQNTDKYGYDKVALREKEYGIWQDVTWHDYYKHIKNLALLR